MTNQELLKILGKARHLSDLVNSTDIKKLSLCIDGENINLEPFVETYQKNVGLSNWLFITSVYGGRVIKNSIYSENYKNKTILNNIEDYLIIQEKDLIEIKVCSFMRVFKNSSKLLKIECLSAKGNIVVDSEKSPQCLSGMDYSYIH